MKRPRRDGTIWNANIEDYLRFQRNFLTHVSDYVRDAGQQAGSGAVDPAAWIKLHAQFWSDVIDDLGAWSLGWQQVLGPDDMRVAMPMKTIAATDSTASIPITVPPEAFVDVHGREVDSVKLANLPLADDGPLDVILARNRKAALLDTERTVAKLGPDRQLVRPEYVTRSKPHTALRLSDLKGRVQPGNVYAAIIFVEETRILVAVARLKVGFDPASDDEGAVASTSLSRATTRRPPPRAGRASRSPR